MLALLSENFMEVKKSSKAFLELPKSKVRMTRTETFPRTKVILATYKMLNKIQARRPNGETRSTDAARFL